jgi:hypothetical protein
LCLLFQEQGSRKESIGDVSISWTPCIRHQCRSSAPPLLLPTGQHKNRVSQKQTKAHDLNPKKKKTHCQARQHKRAEESESKNDTRSKRWSGQTRCKERERKTGNSNIILRCPSRPCELSRLHCLSPLRGPQLTLFVVGLFVVVAVCYCCCGCCFYGFFWRKGGGGC